jgi:hypothetical protein
MHHGTSRPDDARHVTRCQASPHPGVTDNHAVAMACDNYLDTHRWNNLLPMCPEQTRKLWCRKEDSNPCVRYVTDSGIGACQHRSRFGTLAFGFGIDTMLQVWTYLLLALSGGVSAESTGNQTLSPTSTLLPVSADCSIA